MKNALIHSFRKRETVLDAGGWERSKLKPLVYELSVEDTQGEAKPIAIISTRSRSKPFGYILCKSSSRPLDGASGGRLNFSGKTGFTNNVRKMRVSPCSVSGPIVW